MIQVKPLLKLMRVHKPIGGLLLLWPTLWALWIAANGLPQTKLVFIFIMGVWVMRSAGCVINDIADRNFDGQVVRTNNRPLVTGEVTVKTAVWLFVGLCALGLVLVWQLNIQTLWLSFIGLILAMIYPFTKRFTYFPQLFLGTAFAWSVPMAFMAQSGYIPPVGWLLYLVAAIWPVAYDSLYALLDKQDDLKAGIKSTVIFFDAYDLLIIFILQVFVLVGLFVIGKIEDFSGIYFLSLLAAGLMTIHQVCLAIKKDYYSAFKNNHWMGAAVFAGIALNYFFTSH